MFAEDFLWITIDCCLFVSTQSLNAATDRVISVQTSLATARRLPAVISLAQHLRLRPSAALVPRCHTAELITGAATAVR